MPKGIMVVQSNPSDPDREDEFNKWYSEVHLPQVLAVPGFVAARRYRVHDGGAGAAHKYLAIYEIDADDITAPLQQLRGDRAASGGEMAEFLQLDPPPAVTLLELID